MIRFVFTLNENSSITFEQGHHDGSGSNGSQARTASIRDSHLAPGMNKYSTPKAPAEEL
jgi:hypothetical protein